MTMTVSNILTLLLWSLIGVLPAPASTAPAGLTYRQTVVVQVGVSNLDKAVTFYRDVLELKVTERRDDIKFAHIATSVPGLEIGLSEGSALSGTGAAVINFGVADVTAARTLLESRGVKFTGPTQVIPGKVALAGFTDPDENRLRLAGPPPPQ